MYHEAPALLSADVQPQLLKNYRILLSTFSRSSFWINFYRKLKYYFYRVIQLLTKEKAYYIKSKYKTFKYKMQTSLLKKCRGEGQRSEDGGQRSEDGGRKMGME
jgi:hypothetical protein